MPEYVPRSSAKLVDGRFGPEMRLSFNADALMAFADAHRNEKGRIKMKLVPRKAVGQYGDTHSVVLDTWEPKSDGGRRDEQTSRERATEDDVPF